MDHKKFEQLIDLIINENQEQAEQLFHDIIIEKSRQIYEDIMSDEMDEGMGGNVGQLANEISAEEEGMTEEEDGEIDFDDEGDDEADPDHVRHRRRRTCRARAHERGLVALPEVASRQQRDRRLRQFLGQVRGRDKGQVQRKGDDEYAQQHHRVRQKSQKRTAFNHGASPRGDAAAPGRPKQGTAPRGGSEVRVATSVGASSIVHFLLDKTELHDRQRDHDRH